MIHVFHNPRLTARILPLIGLLGILLCSCQGARVGAVQSPNPNELPTLNKLPTLEQALETSHPEVRLEVKRNYSLILTRREQLEISKEVKGHFEKAVTQAEKKFEEEDGDITQSVITKLKLGLAGTLNDIAKFNSDIALAKLKLEKYLGVRWGEEVDISGPILQPASFPHQTVDQFLKSDASGRAPKESDSYDLREAIIEVNKAREQLTLAGKNRKMTRALLVTEAANYDFGIGNEADLFEALIIYTRVLVGYYEAVHTFNIGVYRFVSLFR